jgi:cardiolipin synthase
MAETPIFSPMPRPASRAFALPNLLTYARILAVPTLVLAYYVESYTGRWLSLLIFLVACITDFFDGYLARVWQQQSAIGRLLDPIADKLLVATSLILLASDGTIADWSLLAAIVILTREIFVSGLREFLAELRVSVPVTKLAKWKTTMQMVALAFLLLGPAGDRYFFYPYVTFVGLLLLWISALVTLYTGYDYFMVGFRHLMEDE